MLPDARPSTGWATIDWTLTPAARLYSTLPDITDEFFSILRFVSEIQEEGERLAKVHSGLTDPSAITALYKEVRSFLRQAENFYRAARTAHYRSSALLYYYCFLNLAKAALSIRGITYDRRHGLTDKADPASKDLAMQAVLVGNGGVFPALYNQQVNTTIPSGTRLDICTLLGYVSEITHQYEAANLGQRATFPQCYARLIVEKSDDIAWCAIAVPYVIDFSSLPEPNKANFETEFEEVQMLPNLIREYFGLLGEREVYRFYQSKKTMKLSVGFDRPAAITSLFGALEGFIEPRYIGDGYDFVLSKPYAHPSGSFRMTELLAAYLAMFFLGSLVRYRPDYLDDLLETRAGWIIETFVTSAPLPMLRAFVSKITDKVYVFNK